MIYVVVAIIAFAFGWKLGRDELRDELPALSGDTEGHPRSPWWVRGGSS